MHDPTMSYSGSVEESIILLSGDNDSSDNNYIESQCSIPQNTTQSKYKPCDEADNLVAHMNKHTLKL